MGQVLRSQGWSLISTAPMDPAQGGLKTPNSAVAGSVSGITGLLKEVSPVSVPQVRVIVSNWFGDAAPDSWIPGTNPTYQHLAFWNGTTAIGVRFGGERVVRVDPGAIVVSDPVSFPVSAQVAYVYRHFCGVAGQSLSCITLPQPTGSSTGFSSNGATDSGEGSTAEDVAEVLSSGVTAGSGGLLAVPAAILGYTGTSPAKSIACAGDSIVAGAGDGAAPRPSQGGWCARVALGNPPVKILWPTVTPAYGMVQIARANDTLADFLSPIKNAVPLQLASFATTAISDMGINDVTAGTALGTIETNKVSEAVLYMSQGQMFFGTTLPPQTSSTNNWLDVVSQTKGAHETNRVGYNDFMRQGANAVTTYSGSCAGVTSGAAGFCGQVIQACLANAVCAAATNNNPGAHVAYFDAANTVEVNASNVLTQDGGFWQAGNTCPYTGSVTGSPTSGQFIDTAVSPATQNNFRGSTVAMTSGTQAGKNAVIMLQRSDTKLLVLSTGLSGAPSVSDTYKICSNIQTIDGTHPTSNAAAQIASNFPTGLIQ